MTAVLAAIAMAAKAAEKKAAEKKAMAVKAMKTKAAAVKAVAAADAAAKAVETSTRKAGEIAATIKGKKTGSMAAAERPASLYAF
ncbi:hypothetical protein GCM10010918_17750 [Paenibacillus radicis (ex Gao et al. 2016)]|uniref:Uncharacterized protein n=1 Tax=Paenibacillus radicis (ex Gao et al. 2016) TaxID=1737354 RepID=A0A917H0N2_9BACL|nr:hypothetical protein GCM10010918_17750 [Paenibacillus radicis (ex Gao et al. 2016)]